ncbi:CCHC-type domain-containing protein [Heracleum sosnowskyi]|uniref:CCHC-type domain-containing protein n=1 Tax=Heracleum sosnowskyi TaxID=360622 RepID=A0AAD8N396_9APIA|nr:CCHC-type domain-containing protein [Heracleum sosnowskyi]
MYQLEQEVNSLSQESLSIQEFCSAIMLLWNEMDMIEEKIPEAALETVLKLRLQTRARQFFMKLWQDFEPIHATILNCGGSSSVDTILPDLLAEETRLKSLSSHINVHDVALSAAFQKVKARNMSNTESFICHETGHIAIQCSKKKGTTGNVSTSLFCRYCKGEGHLIENCKIRPPRNRSHRAYMSSVPSISEATGTLNQHHVSQSNSPSPDFIQQVIQALQDSNIVHALQASNVGYHYISTETKSSPSHGSSITDPEYR